MGKFVSEFKEFALKGNVIDMAIGIIVGGAFGKIVTSLVNDIIMPPIAAFLNTGQFAELKAVLKPAAVDAVTGEEIAAVTINYGSFIQSVLDFLIIAFCIFMVIRSINKLRKPKEEAPAAPAEPTEDVKLLTEIRDLLRKQ
ncbi:MAG: large-conductance mechanosensitive channel protein MscL [Porphyromonas sp.]|jgi:large conductance mechanosensitive channel|nr:large-conductance mechanosensitive channel protein MscL [Porphyromonas sp.]